MTSRRRLQLALLCASLFALASACAKDPAALREGAGSLPALHDPLSGGDDRAWLNASGSLPGTSYCANPLILPLAKEPVWEFTYTPAELSDRDAWQILHYDGRIVVSTRGPQMAVLDARSGQKLFSQDLYFREAGVHEIKEMFDSILFSETGRLLGMDDQGRYYCWALNAGSFQRVWLGDRVRYGRAGMLGLKTCLVSGSDDVIYGADLASGDVLWRVPAMQPNSGIMVDSKGRALCWSTINQISQVDTNSGQPLWTCSTSSTVDSCTINEWLGCFYAVYKDENVECRGLDKGELLWSYRWSDLMDSAERKRRAAAIDWPGVSLGIGTTSALPDGVVLQLLSGDVVVLDRDGSLRWHHRMGTGAYMALAFPNGIVVGQAYSRPGRKLRPSWLDPFNLEEPDWQLIKDAAALRKSSGAESPSVEHGVRELWFTRLAVLSPADGSEIDSFEPDVMPVSGLTPACGNIVFGGTQTLEEEILSRRNKEESVVRRVRAYPWLQSEAD